jgi:hypothetical protein
MGCNQSRSKDIEDSRRVRTDAMGGAGHVAQAPVASSQPMAAAAELEQDEFRGVAESYTDRQMRETDLLKAVIHRTSRLFIDIAQIPIEATSPEQPSHMPPLAARLGDGAQDALLQGPWQTDPAAAVDSLLGPPPPGHDPDALAETFAYLAGDRHLQPLVDVGDIVFQHPKDKAVAAPALKPE